jgi:hypothetical protein
LSIKRKGASIAFTATLLASLLMTVAAPLVSAAVTVTSAGTVPRGGTSGGTATFVFTENAAACFAAGASPAALTVTINDVDGGDVTFTGTPAVTAPGSLGATATVAGNVLTINFAASDIANIEQITVSGLGIAAATTATAGAISATLGGSQAACVASPTPATGVVATGIGLGATSVVMSNTSGACLFVATGTLTPGGTAGNLVFATGESVPIVAAAAPGVDVPGGTVPGPGQQELTIGATTAIHNAGESGSQANVCAPSLALASPGTVANALTQTVSAPTPQVIPGENNQPTASVSLSESPSGTATTFVNGQVVTFTISNPGSGVVFSASPAVTGPVGPGAVCALSFDRKSCTVTVTAATAGIDVLTLGPIAVDVAGSVPLGTPVRIVAGVSPTVAVNVVGSTVAFVGRVVVGVAAQPTIYIGENDQATGLITLTESGAGFFVAGVGSNNTFALCLATGEVFTRAPWAVVTSSGGTPGLQLLSGVVGASQVVGTLYNGGSCAYWTVFSASTTGAGIIEIRGSADGSTPLPTGANNGPRVNVPPGLAPGTTQAAILIGTNAAVVGSGGCSTVPGCTANAAFSSIVSNAVRAFRSGVVVSAVSQPVIDRGDTDALAGNITITETLNGQFKPGQVIFVQILARANTLRQDVLLNTANTNNQPIVTTNAASGLATSPPTFGGITPNPIVCQNAIPLVAICGFAFTITQQSFGPTLGQITISNLHYFVLPDAVNGPVQVQVSSSGLTGGPVNGVAFQSVVSNARVGAATQTSIANLSALGVQSLGTVASFTTSTKVTRAGTYVTWRAQMSPAASGERVEVWVARRAEGSSTWTPFVKLTTRAVNAQGLAYFSWRTSDITSPYTNQAGWLSVRFRFAGNASHNAATSLARQAHFTP